MGRINPVDWVFVTLLALVTVAGILVSSFWKWAARIDPIEWVLLTVLAAISAACITYLVMFFAHVLGVV